MGTSRVTAERFSCNTAQFDDGYADIIMWSVSARKSLRPGADGCSKRSGSPDADGTSVPSCIIVGTFIATTSSWEWLG